MDETKLRSSFQRVTRRDGAGRASCPDAAELTGLVVAELDEQRRHDVVEHVAMCSSCTLEVRIVESLRVESADDSGRRASITSSHRAWAVAAAAAIVVAVGVSVLKSRSPSPSPPASARQAVEPEIRALIEEDVPLRRSQLSLRWSSLGEGLSYDLSVANTDLEVLYEASGLESTEHRVPETAIGTVAPGARLLWRVEAVYPDGSRLQSPAFFAILE